MVKKICDQREVIPVAVFDIKRAAGDGVVTIGDAGRNRVLPCDFKDIRPVNRPDFRVAIVPSQRDPEQSVANGQAQNFPFVTFVGVQQFSQKLSRHGHQRRHAAGEIHPHRMLRGEAMLFPDCAAFANSFGKIFEPLCRHGRE